MLFTSGPWTSWATIPEAAAPPRGSSGGKLTPNQSISKQGNGDMADPLGPPPQRSTSYCLLTSAEL